MVQPPRLKRSFHPLFPLVAFLVLGALFVLIFNKSVQEKLFNTFSGYQHQRSTYIDMYNTLKTEQTQLLTKPYSNLGTYRLNLTKSLDLNMQIREILKKINELDSEVILTYESVDLNIVQDEQRSFFYSSLSDLITKKIDSIDMYNNIVKLDKCIRGVKTKKELEECKVIYTQIRKSGVVVTAYKNEVDSLFLNYFSLSKLQRTKKINKLVPYHNMMINKLEVVINSPISL